MGRTVQRLVIFAVTGLFPTILYAQASITGSVKDPSGAVLPGVTVEASSPALIEKVRSAVTDGSGQYRIIDLRPGMYTITFTLTGFGSVKREGIELTGSFTATVNADLQVGSIAETVTVSGASPIIDVQNTRQQRVLAKDVIEALPTGRTPASLAVLIPGVTGLAGTQDVGGTDTLGSVTQVTIHGGRTNDFRSMTDGFNTAGNKSGLQYNNTQPNVGSTEEVNIDTAGSSADNAQGGILVNFVPKDGGNRFSGSMFLSGANENMASSNLTQRLKDGGVSTDIKIKSTYDINPAFGGPVKKDKLWFFTSFRQFGYENYQGMFHNLNAGIKDVYTYVPDPSKPAFNKSYSRSGNARLTWQINQKNKLSTFFDTQYKCECLQSGNSAYWAKSAGWRVSPESVNEFYDTPIETGTITWSSPVTSRLLVEGGVAWRREDYSVRYATEGDPKLDLVPVIDIGTGMIYHGPVEAGGPRTNAYIYNNSVSWTPQARASLSYVSGAHALKVGFHEQYLKAHDTYPDNNAHVSYRFNNGVPFSLYQRSTPSNLAGSAPWDLGIYAQERWTTKRLTLDLGVRYSYYQNESPDQVFGPAALVPTRNFTIPATKFYSLKDLTPRLGASYDLFGTGRTAVKVAANKYLTSPSPFAGNPGSSLILAATRNWNDSFYPVGDSRRGNFIPDCELTSTAANGECGALSDANFGSVRPSATFDPATYRGWGARGNNWEFMTTVQHELIHQVSIDLGYFRRMYGNLLVTYNRALPPANYNPYSITAPVDARLGSNSGQVISGLYDLNPAFTVGGIPVDNYQTFADNFGKQYEHWNGIDVGVRARLPNVFLSAGLSTGRTSTDNCDVVGKLSNPSPLYCHVDTNFLTQVKGYGSYTVPRVDVQIAGTFQSIPGPQLTASYNVPTAVVAQSLGRPLSAGAAFATVNIVPPGTMYGERVNQLDMRFGKNFTLRGTRAAVYLDLYNLSNSDTVLIENSSYTVWRQPLSVLKARFAKVSAQFNF